MADENLKTYYSTVFVDVEYDKKKEESAPKKVDVDNQADVSDIENALKNAKPGMKLTISADTGQIVKETNSSVKEANKSGDLDSINPPVDFKSTDILSKVNESIDSVNSTGKVHAINGSVYFDPDKVAAALQNALGQTGVDKQPNTKSEAVDVDKTKTENEIKDLTEKTPIKQKFDSKKWEHEHNHHAFGIKGKEKTFTSDLDYAKFMSKDRHDFFIKVNGKLLTDELVKGLSATTRKLWDNYKAQLKGASTAPKNLKKPVNPELDKDFKTYSKKDQEALKKAYEGEMYHYEEEMDILTNKARVQEKEAKYPRATSIPAINLTFQRLLEGLAEDENVVTLGKTSTTKEIDGKTKRIYMPDTGVKKTIKYREEEIKRKGDSVLYVPDYHPTTLFGDSFSFDKKGSEGDILKQRALEIFKLREASVFSPRDSASLEITNVITSLLAAKSKSEIADIMFGGKNNIEKLFKSKGIDYDFSYWYDLVLSGVDEEPDLGKYKDSIEAKKEELRLKRQSEQEAFNKRWGISPRPKPEFSYIPNLAPHEAELLEQDKIAKKEQKQIDNLQYAYSKTYEFLGEEDEYKWLSENYASLYPEEHPALQFVSQHLDELIPIREKEAFIKSSNGGMDETSTSFFEAIKIAIRKRLMGSIESLKDIENFPEYNRYGTEFSKGNKLRSNLEATIDSLVTSVFNPKGFFDRYSMGNGEYKFTGPFQIPNIFKYVFNLNDLTDEEMKGVHDESEVITAEITRMLYNSLANKGKSSEELKKIFDVGLLPRLNIDGITSLEQLNPSYMAEVEKEKKELSAKQQKMMKYEHDELIQQYLNDSNQWYFHFPRSAEDIEEQKKKHKEIVDGLKKKNKDVKGYKLPKEVKNWKPKTTETIYVSNPAIAAMAEVAKEMRDATDEESYSELQGKLNQLESKAFEWDDTTKTFGMHKSKRGSGYDLTRDMIHAIQDYSKHGNKVPIYVKSSFTTNKEFAGLTERMRMLDAATTPDELFTAQEEITKYIDKEMKKSTEKKGYRQWFTKRFKIASDRVYNKPVSEITDEEVERGTLASEFTAFRRTNLMKLDDRPIVPMDYKKEYNVNPRLQKMNESLRALYDAYISGKHYKREGAMNDTDFVILAKVIDDFTEAFIEEEEVLRNGKKDKNGKRIKDYNFRQKQAALMGRKQKLLRILGPSGLGLNIDEIGAIRVKSLEKAFYQQPGETAQSIFKHISDKSGYMNPYRVVNVEKIMKGHWAGKKTDIFDIKRDYKTAYDFVNSSNEHRVEDLDEIISELQEEVLEYNKEYWEYFKTYVGNESKPKQRGVIEKRYGNNVQMTGYYATEASKKFGFGEFMSKRAHFKRMDKLNENIKKLEMSAGLYQEVWIGENGELVFGEKNKKMTKDLEKRYGTETTAAVLEKVVQEVMKQKPKDEAKNFQSIMDMYTAYENYGPNRVNSPYHTALVRIAHQSSIGKEFFENLNTFIRLRKGEISQDKVKFYNQSPNEKVYKRDENGELLTDENDNLIVDDTEYDAFLKNNLYDIFTEWSLFYPELNDEMDATKRQLEFDRLYALTKTKNPRIRMREPTKDEFEFADTIVSRQWPFDVKGNLKKAGNYENIYAGDKGLESILQIRKSLQNNDFRKHAYSYIQKYHRQFLVGIPQEKFDPNSGKGLFVKTLANLMFFKEGGELRPNINARLALQDIFKDTFGMGETGKLPQDLLTQIIDIAYHKITGEVPATLKAEVDKYKMSNFLDEFKDESSRIEQLTDPASKYSTDEFRKLFSEYYPEVEVPPVRPPELSQEEIDNIIKTDIGDKAKKDFEEYKRTVYPFDVSHGVKKAPTKGSKSKKGKKGKKGKKAEYNENKYLDFDYLFSTDEEHLGYLIKTKAQHPEIIDEIYNQFENWHKTYVKGEAIEGFSPDSGKGLLTKTLVNWYVAKPEQFTKLFNSIFGEEKGGKVTKYVTDISAKAQREYDSKNLHKVSKFTLENHPEYHVPFDDEVDDLDRAKIVGDNVDTTGWYSMPGWGMFGEGVDLENFFKESSDEKRNTRNKYLQTFYDKLLTLTSAGMDKDKAFQYLSGYLSVIEESENKNVSAEKAFNAIYDKLYAKSKSGKYVNTQNKDLIYNTENYKKAQLRVSQLYGTKYFDEADNYLKMMGGTYDKDLGGLITSVWKRNAKDIAKPQNQATVSQKVLNAQEAYADVERIVNLLSGTGTIYEQKANALFAQMGGKYKGSLGGKIRELEGQFVNWQVNQSNLPLQTPVVMTKTQMKNQQKYNDAQDWVNEMVGTPYESESKRWFGYMKGQFNSSFYKMVEKIHMEYLKSLGPQKPPKPPKQPSQRQIDIQNKMVQFDQMHNALIGTPFQKEADAIFNMMGTTYNNKLFDKMTGVFGRSIQSMKNFADEKVKLDDIERKFGKGSKKYKNIEKYFNEMTRLNDKSGPDAHNFESLYNQYMGKKEPQNKAPISSIFAQFVTGFVNGVINKFTGMLMGIGNKALSMIGDIFKKSIMLAVNPFKKSVMIFSNAIKKAGGQSKVLGSLSELLIMPLVLATEFTLLPVIKKLIPAIKDTINWVVASKDKFELMGKAIANVANKVYEMLTGNFVYGFEKVFKVFEGFSTWINEEYTNTDTFFTKLDLEFEDFSENISKIGETASLVNSQLVAFAQSKEIGQIANNVTSEMISTFGTVIYTSFSAINELLKNPDLDFAGLINQTFEEILKSMTISTDVVANLVDNFSEAIANILDDDDGIYKDMKDKVKSNLQRIIKGVMGAFSEVIGDSDVQNIMWTYFKETSPIWGTMLGISGGASLLGGLAGKGIGALFSKGGSGISALWQKFLGLFGKGGTSAASGTAAKAGQTALDAFADTGVQVATKSTSLLSKIATVAGRFAGIPGILVTALQMYTDPTEKYDWVFSADQWNMPIKDLISTVNDPDWVNYNNLKDWLDVDWGIDTSTLTENEFLNLSLSDLVSKFGTADEVSLLSEMKTMMSKTTTNTFGTDGVTDTSNVTRNSNGEIVVDLGTIGPKSENEAAIPMSNSSFYGVDGGGQTVIVDNAEEQVELSKGVQNSLNNYFGNKLESSLQQSYSAADVDKWIYANVEKIAKGYSWDANALDVYTQREGVAWRGTAIENKLDELGNAVRAYRENPEAYLASVPEEYKYLLTKQISDITGTMEETPMSEIASTTTPEQTEVGVSIYLQNSFNQKENSWATKVVKTNTTNAQLGAVNMNGY